MIIHNISNYENLFKILDTCNDDLTLITPDGNVYDLKEQKNVLHSLLEVTDMKKYNKMELRFSNSQDMSHILCYLMECEIGN